MSIINYTNINDRELNVDTLFSKPVCAQCDASRGNRQAMGDPLHSASPICMTDDRAATIRQ